jgi:hypothetical protein
MNIGANSKHQHLISPGKNDWLAVGSKKSLNPRDFEQADLVAVRFDSPTADDALIAAGMALAKGRPTALVAPTRNDLPWFMREADQTYPGQVFVAEGQEGVTPEQVADLRGVEIDGSQSRDTFIGCLMSGLTKEQYAEGRSHLMAINKALAEKLGSENNYCEGISVGSIGSFDKPRDSLRVDLEAVKGANHCVFYQYDDSSRPSGMWVELGAALAWGKPCVLFAPNLNGVPDAVKKGLNHLKVVEYGSHQAMLAGLESSPERLLFDAK